jgi:hypothetical protein
MTTWLGALKKWPMAGMWYPEGATRNPARTQPKQRQSTTCPRTYPLTRSRSAPHRPGCPRTVKSGRTTPPRPCPYAGRVPTRQNCDPGGPVRLELAFLVGPRRNWLGLWTQTIDSLDPLLGRTYPDRDWHPLDGRMTELGMHLTVDRAHRDDVVIGIAAAPAS